MLWSIDSCQNRISVDQYHLTVPRAEVLTHRDRVFFLSYPLTDYQFQMISGSSLFFPMIHIKYVVFMSLWPTTTRISISNWPRTWKYGQARPYLTMVMRWSRSTSNFCTLIGQNLAGEFMRKIYAASWKLFTLTAETDRVLCQLVMFLTVFFHWMYKLKYSYYQESSVIHGWFVSLGFWLRNASLVKIGFSDFVRHRFRFSPCLMRKRRV